MIERKMDNAAHAVALETKGFLDDTEGLRLYDLALEASILGPCLEIGSYCGKSSIYLGSACKERGAVLFSIDHHTGSEEQQPGELYFDASLVDPRQLTIDTFFHFRRSISKAHLTDTIIPIAADSEVAGRVWKMPLSMVFIDGGHAYHTVLSDYQTWAPHVIHHGYLVFHDVYPNPEDGGQAPYFVYRMALELGKFEEIPGIGSLGILKRIR
jgi:MMP 1-O-methyltransferase